jgi:HK97 family phage portal protein
MSFMNMVFEWINGSELSRTDISRHDTLSLPPVWYAHNKICGDIGILPLDVKKNVGRGSINDTKHFGYKLLREQPNELQSPSVFKEQITSHAILYGNGRAAIIRSGDAASELIPMMPDRTWSIVYRGTKWHVTKPNKHDERPLFDPADFIADPNGYLVFADSDVLHITGFSFDGIEGIGLLDIGQPTFRTGKASQTHTNKQLEKGFRGKLMLEAPAGAFRSEAQAREFLETFNKTESGPDNAGKAGLLREGVKANALNMSNNDAQFIELNKFNRQDVGLLFGMTIPGDGESVSYNSLEQKELADMKATNRWMVKWEEQCDMKLRTPTQKRLQTHYFKFNRHAIHSTDLQTTMTAFGNAITHRIMSPNEVRAKLDLNPYDGGDEYFNPAVTPGGSSQSEPAESQDDMEEDSSEVEDASSDSQNRRALEETIRSLLAREANNAISGAKSKNFLDWIDKNYAKWEPKLAEKLEVLGLDRDLARIHCDESRRILLEIAGESTQENLENNVKNAVETWKNRTFLLIGDNR